MKRISNFFIMTLGVFLLPGKMHSMGYELPVEEEQPEQEDVLPVPMNPNEVLVWTAATSDIPGMEGALRDGADINTFQGRGNMSKWPPLIFAVNKGELETIKFLLDHKANMYVVDRDGVEAIGHLYGDLGHKQWQQIAQLFLDHGFPINRQLKHSGDTLLTMAISRADCPTVTFLLGKGADSFIRNKENKNALDIARNKKHCLKELAVFLAAEEAKKGVAATKEFLKEYPGMVNIIVDEKDNTLLHYAVEANHKTWIVYLLGQGANPTLKNSRGESPIDIARAKGPGAGLIQIFSKAAGSNVPKSGTSTPAAASSSSQK